MKLERGIAMAVMKIKTIKSNLQAVINYGKMVIKRIMVF